MTDYLGEKPSLEDYWRGIILFGKNVACYNTKGKQETREIQIHPRLMAFLEEYSAELKGKNPFLFPGRHRRGHIHRVVQTGF